MLKMFEMFLGADGKVSCLRVCTIFVVVCVMGVFVAMNIISMCHGQGFVSIGWDMVSLVAGVLGVKTLQQRNENSGYNGNGNGNGKNVIDDVLEDLPKKPVPPAVK